MFSCEFCEISKNTFLTEHLRATASFELTLEMVEKRWFSNFFYCHLRDQELLSVGLQLFLSISLPFPSAIFLTWRLKNEKVDCLSVGREEGT